MSEKKFNLSQTGAQVQEILNSAKSTDQVLTEIQEAMEDLPDGQAVSAQVALNTAAIQELDANKASKTEVVFDISAYHATGGVLAEYADLTAALGTNGANIPDALRKGGMSVKFVQSSDNKYVQYRCMVASFSTNAAQWQGVDETPTVESNNLVISGGVKKELDDISIKIGDSFDIPFVLNKCWTLGRLYDLNGFVATPNMITIYENCKITLGANSLGYYFRNVELFDIDGVLLSTKNYNDTQAKRTITYDEIIALEPNANYVHINFFVGNWTGSTPALTPSDVEDWILTINNTKGLKEEIETLKGNLEELQSDVEELQPEVIEVHSNVKGLNTVVGLPSDALFATILLNKSIGNSNGVFYNSNGWLATDKTPIKANQVITLNSDNSLEYYFYDWIAYAEDESYLGYGNLGRNDASKKYICSVNDIITAYPTAKYVGINIWNTDSPHKATQITQSEISDLFVMLDKSVLQNIKELQENTDELQKEVNSLKEGTIELTLNKNNKRISIKSDLSDNYQIVNSGFWRAANDYNNNPCFNFGGTTIINKTSGVSTEINNEVDNLGAPNTQVGYIGANHGLFAVMNATITGHGKTFADIGSEWNGSDGHKWYIVRIINENTIAFVSEYYQENGVYKFYTSLASSDTLIHSQGATHTESMTVGSVGQNQWYPSELIIEQKVLLDGKEVVESGIYNGNIVDFVEVYEVYNPVSYLDKLVSLVGTLSANPLPCDYDDIAKWMRICNDYRFTKGGCNVLFVDWIALDTIDLNSFNPVDVKTMKLNSLGGSAQYYLPKALPLTIDGLTFDYRRPATFDYSKDLHWIESDWENPLLPPDRGIEFLTNGTKRVVGLHHGYLFDQGIGGTTRKDYIMDAWWIYTSGAVYAGGVNGGKFGNTTRQQIGSHYGFAVFRKYEDVSDNVSGLISNSQFDANGSHYIYVDVEAAGLYSIPIEDEWCGKEIEILEKSSNVELLNSLSQKEILVNVTTSNPMYGYLVAKLTKF